MQDAELGGFDAQKIMRHLIVLLLTQEEILPKILNTPPSIFLLYPKTENGTFRSSTERTMKTTDILGRFRFLVVKDDTDADFAETAIRETWEEIGVTMSQIKIVRELSHLYSAK